MDRLENIAKRVRDAITEAAEDGDIGREVTINITIYAETVNLFDADGDRVAVHTEVLPRTA